MKISQAVSLYESYLKDNARPNTIRSFMFTLQKFSDKFQNKSDMFDVSDSDIIEFIHELCQNTKASTKSGRVSCLKAFYNFIIEATDSNKQNPCARPIIRRMFKQQKHFSPKLLDKDIVNEIIFRNTNPRDRLILELMGRTGMRIGEVLNTKVKDIDFNSSTILLQQPKSGRTGEKVYLPKKLSNKLQQYITKNYIKEDTFVFNISYSTAYRMVRKSAKLVDNSNLRPHDLRRHAVTLASRDGIPLEVISKVICRHSSVLTTQRYLGSIDPNEASRWVEHFNR